MRFRCRSVGSDRYHADNPVDDIEEIKKSAPMRCAFFYFFIQYSSEPGKNIERKMMI